jgi:6,7-dimethyl-8-ribityllumazine synthase
MNKVAIVHSGYYPEIIEKLLKGIYKNIDNSFELNTFKVPGSWDIVYKINTLSKEYNIFIAVGVICKGETDHYEYISYAVANGLINLSIKNSIYIGNCVLNVHNLEQAKERTNDKNNKGCEASKAINLLFT